jgi:GPH family glycoside/pentoside/hexuronide:cation symporter
MGFGVCDLGGNLFFTALGFWSLNYLTDTVGLSAALAGTAVMVGKLWDAVTDPVMGYISDRTRSRWGRRRPYLLFGSLPLLVAMVFFFTNPHLHSPVLLTLWAIVALMFLNTAYTVVNIPYNSLTPELTADYHERTSLNGFRFGFAVIGTIVGAAAVQPILGAFPNKSAGFSAVGAILGLIMALAALTTFFSVREQAHSREELPREGFFSTYLGVFKNIPYLIVLITFALHLMALNFLQGILVYYTKYVYKNEGLTTPSMILLLVVAMACIPVSVWVSKKIGKKRTYQIAFAVLAVACGLIFSFGHLWGPSFFLGMMVFAGVGIGFGYVAPWAMVPDTIEYDAHRTGERKEGAFYGMWTFTSKVGQSLSILISGLILSAGGYVAEAAQSSRAIFAIRLIIGPLPLLVFVGALVLIQFYPLDEKTYRALMAQAPADQATQQRPVQ